MRPNPLSICWPLALVFAHFVVFQPPSRVARAWVTLTGPRRPVARRIASTLYANDANGDSSSSNGNTQDDTISPVTKASWYAVEAFGKLFAPLQNKAAGGSDTSAPPTTAPPQSVQETMARIQADNERQYFLSGEIDQLIYDEQCEFADPFVSFRGRDRFVENLQNLGAFITDYSARPLEYRQQEATVVQTKFMVKLQLNLPWKPVLAWPWGVRCVIDPDTFLIVLHEERWDIDAWEGVQQIFRKPSTSVR